MEDKDSKDSMTAKLKRPLEGEQSDPKRTANGKVSPLDNSAEETDHPEAQGPEEAEQVNGSKGKAEDEHHSTEQEEEQEPEEEVKNASESEEEEEEEQEPEEEDPMRLEAVEALTAIEIEFATLRDQIHSNQVARFDFELMLCSKGLHPELQVVEERIKERHNHKTTRTDAALKYQLSCISNQTRAMRDHLHQQFLKDRHDIRTELLRKTTREWYQVNDERRAADKLVPEYGYRAEQVTQNDEIPLLVAISKYQGFPAAPSIMGASEFELERDLLELRK